jgi:hypothetical protein
LNLASAVADTSANLIQTSRAAVHHEADMTVTHHKNVGILVGGGPAPGINSVISAATIRAELEGIDVVGIRRLRMADAGNVST